MCHIHKSTSLFINKKTKHFEKTLRFNAADYSLLTDDTNVLQTRNAIGMNVIKVVPPFHIL